MTRKLEVLSVLIENLFWSTLAVPIVVVMKILKPLLLIRLGRLDSGRIGAFYDADWYLSERQSSEHDDSSRDFFYFLPSSGSVCNRQWVKMWKRVLPSVPCGKLAHAVNKINQHLPGYEPHKIPDAHVIPSSDKINGTDVHSKLKCILARQEPFISFTAQEEEKGKYALQKLGIPDGASFICFHARDSAYLDSICKKRNWRYHDFRDSDIQNYIPAVEKIVERGYSAIRMGAVVKKELRTKNSLIIDYATNGMRTDFMDVYLGAKCRFFLCSDTGISIIPEMFRRPTVYANWVPLSRISPWVLNGLFIPKKFYLRKADTHVTFREIINSEMGSHPKESELKKKGIELIENTPEEIEAVTIEMEERLKGTWQSSREDEELQQRFWNLFGPNKIKSPDFRIGTEFLKQNLPLLD